MVEDAALKIMALEVTFSGLNSNKFHKSIPTGSKVYRGTNTD
jgi:hypothetical protein